MTAQSELADLYVKFSTKGSAALNKEIDRKKSKLIQAAGAAVTFAKTLAGGAAVAAQNLGNVAQRALVVSGILKGIVLGQGLSGTKEAETLGSAFSLLARTIADVFAPVVRGVTQGLIEVSRWMLSLSQETKTGILSWTLLAGAALGFAVVLPKIVTAVSAVVSALGLLASKFVLIPGLIVGVVAALLYLTAEGDTFGERSVSVLTTVTRFWASLKAVLLSVWESVKALGVAMYRLFTADFEGAYKAVTTELADNWKQVWANAQKEFDRAPQSARNVAAEIQGVMGNIANLQKAAQSLAGNDTALGRIMRAFQNNKPLEIKASVDFVGGQQMWERMMRATGNDQQRQIDQLENIRRGIDNINANGVKINNAPAVVR